MEVSSTQHELDESQKQAIALCTDPKKRLVAVTGSAGSGKTTILRTVYNLLQEAGYKIALCSPTGKAAKRITEATGIEAFTIHRLLEYTHPGDPDPRTGRPMGVSVPRRNRSFPLEYDFVFADEYAMVNRDVHNALLSAIPVGGAIRVFGDANQLRPIDDKNKIEVVSGRPPTKSPFEEVLDNAALPSARLTNVYRQGPNSGILTNLMSILKGIPPTRNEQWDMLFTDYPVMKLEDEVMQALEAGHNFGLPQNQIITLQHRSWTGTANLNKVLKRLLNPNPSKSIPIPRNSWVVGDDGCKGSTTMMGVGDKVIITRNIYDLEVMNGESGVIIDITSDGEVVIDFGDKEQVIPPSMLVLNRYNKVVEIDPRRDIDLAYALTTHKTQGSEYDRVIYVLNKSMMFMASRRNLYTGCSRGRHHVSIITDKQSLRKSLADRS